MTSIMRRRLLVVATSFVTVALLVATIQAAFAAAKTFRSLEGDTDDTSWPYKHSYGTVPVGDPSDSYHMAINHWNPSSNGPVTMAFDNATVPIAFEVTEWGDTVTDATTGAIDFTTSASVVYKNKVTGTWVWSDVEGQSDPNSGHFHAPAGYPDAYTGCHWGQCTYDNTDWGKYEAGTPFPIRASDIKNLMSTWKIELATGSDAASADSVWDAAYDIWLDTGTRTIEAGLNTTYDKFVGFPILPGFPGALKQWVDDDQKGQNDGAEIMIWMNNHGYENQPITPAGAKIASAQTIPGITGTWDVWAGRIGPIYKWNVISYVRTTGVTEMVGFDANKFIQDAASRTCPANDAGDTQCVKSDWWLTSVQTGFEVWAKGAGLKTTEFSVIPNTDRQVDAGRTDGSGNPLIHWQQKFLVRYKPTCEATTVSYTITDTSAATPDVTGTMKKVVPDAEGTADMWAARVGPILDVSLPEDQWNLSHGDATITFTPDCGSATTINAYIDPSGHVVNTLGEPIENATVTLMNAPGIASSEPEPAAGDFTMVPDGSTIMSPANRDNPDLTDANGYYRWDVVDGWYKVQAENTGCTSAESPALPVSDGNPATAVNLVLDCGAGGNDLLVQVTPQNDWGSGYCSNVTITNNTSEAVDWQINIDVEGSIYDFWNVIWSQSGNTVTAEGVDWNNILQPGETSHSIGFCANRSGGGVPPTPPPGGVTVSVTTQSDWNTGYCANVTVTNNGSTPADWQVTFPVTGTVNNLWNAIWSQSGNQVTMEGVNWNNILQPGESSHSIGFCAAK